MERAFLNNGRCNEFVLAALEDYGYGLRNDMNLTTIVNKETEAFTFELELTTRYHGENVREVIHLTIEEYTVFLLHGLKIQGIDIDKVHLHVKNNNLRVEFDTALVEKPFYHHFTKKKRRRR